MSFSSWTTTDMSLLSWGTAVLVIGIVLTFLLSIINSQCSSGYSTQPILGYVIIIIGCLIIAYHYYKEKNSRYIWILMATVILSGLFLSFIELTSNPMSCYSVNPTNSISQQLQKAEVYKESTFIGMPVAEFKKNMIYYNNASYLSEIVGNGTITFECDSQLSAYCEGGNTLLIKEDFSALVSACCNIQNQCKVKISGSSEETAKC